MCSFRVPSPGASKNRHWSSCTEVRALEIASLPLRISLRSMEITRRQSPASMGRATSVYDRSDSSSPGIHSTHSLRVLKLSQVVSRSELGRQPERLG